MGHDARHHAAPARQLALPILIFGLPEVRRVRRELESLEEFIKSAEIRAPGTQPQLPRLSRMCEALATENNLNLLQPTDRKLLFTFIKGVETAAPKIHMSFAADPSSAFTAKMVTWLRANIHRYAMMEVGLQPNIAAGCTVRTPNKVFDFSLRQRFMKTQSTLVEVFEAEAAAAARAEAIQAAQAPAPEPEAVVAVASQAAAFAAVPGGPKSGPEYSQSGLATAATLQPQVAQTPQPQAVPVSQGAPAQ